MHVRRRNWAYLHMMDDAGHAVEYFWGAREIRDAHRNVVGHGRPSCRRAAVDSVRAWFLHDAGAR